MKIFRIVHMKIKVFETFLAYSVKHHISIDDAIELAAEKLKDES